MMMRRMSERAGGEAIRLLLALAATIAMASISYGEEVQANGLEDQNNGTGTSMAETRNVEDMKQLQVSTREDYNREQLRRAWTVMAFAERQKGNTCVFYQLRGAMQAVGMNPISAEEYIAMMGSIEDTVFIGSAFSKAGLTGQYYGGLGGLIENHRLTSEEKVKALMIEELNAGKIVMMSLDPYVIYDEYQRLYGGTYKKQLIAKAHALRVVALEEQVSGEFDAWLYDTSGPERLYKMKLAVVMDAYQSVRVFRAIYISDAKAFGAVKRNY